MTYQEAMEHLEKAGTEQNRKVFRKHGVKNEQFGVSFAELDRLAKQIRKEKGLDREALAVQLWESGNHDARLLATKIADPVKIQSGTVDLWVLDLDNYVIMDALSGLVTNTPFAIEKMQAWIGSDEEFIAAAGWNILGGLAMNDTNLDDAYFNPYLAEIQGQIHTRKNRVRHSMNNAMIAIGIRNHSLENRALTAAAQVGVVYVDHGETNCKTPDAASYIAKAWERRVKLGKN